MLLIVAFFRYSCALNNYDWYSQASSKSKAETDSNDGTTIDIWSYLSRFIIICCDCMINHLFICDDKLTTVEYFRDSYINSSLTLCLLYFLSWLYNANICLNIYHRNKLGQRIYQLSMNELTFIWVRLSNSVEWVNLE